MSGRHQFLRHRLLAAFSSVVVVVEDGNTLDNLNLADGVAVRVDTLDSNDDNGGHNAASSQLPRGDCRPPPSGGQATHDFSYITRDEVSIAKEKHNNISLHQSRSHLVLTSACQ